MQANKDNTNHTQNLKGLNKDTTTHAMNGLLKCCLSKEIPSQQRIRY